MHWVLGVLGAIVGGVLGYFAFVWLLQQGLYAMVLPGALIGLGCGLANRSYSIPLGIVCGIGALCLGAYLEWQFFEADQTLLEFLRNLHAVTPISLIMIAIGAALSFSIGKGRPQIFKQVQTSQGD